MWWDIAPKFHVLFIGVGVWGLGFGVWGLGFGVWGLGFGVWGNLIVTPPQDKSYLGSEREGREVNVEVNRKPFTLEPIKTLGPKPLNSYALRPKPLNP